MSQREGPFWDAVAGRTPLPPASQLLGCKLLEVDPERATIKVEFQASPEFVNSVGVIQGGFLAAMLDETLGPALVATLGREEFAPTVELKANFIRSVGVGPLVGEGRVVHNGKTLAFLQGELRTIDGQLVATATATAHIRTRK